MAKNINQGKDPNEGTRKRTRRAKGKWETALSRNATRSGSETSWNRSVNKPPRPKGSAKKLNKK